MIVMLCLPPMLVALCLLLPARCGAERVEVAFWRGCGGAVAPHGGGPVRAAEPYVRFAHSPPLPPQALAPPQGGCAGQRASGEEQGRLKVRRWARPTSEHLHVLRF